MEILKVGMLDLVITRMESSMRRMSIVSSAGVYIYRLPLVHPEMRESSAIRFCDYKLSGACGVVGSFLDV